MPPARSRPASGLVAGRAGSRAARRLGVERGGGAAVQAEGFLGRLRGWRHRGSGAVKGFGVGEHAVQAGLVLGQDADLEVRLPFRPGRGDLVNGAELESEPLVISRVAE